MWEAENLNIQTAMQQVAHSHWACLVTECSDHMPADSQAVSESEELHKQPHTQPEQLVDFHSQFGKVQSFRTPTDLVEGNSLG